MKVEELELGRIRNGGVGYPRHVMAKLNGSQPAKTDQILRPAC